MPLNLDTCITGIFVPGNIGASSGETPVVRIMPPAYDPDYDPDAVAMYSLDYRYYYNSMYVLLLMV